MLTLTLAIAGPVVCARLIAAGRRADSAARVRGLGTRARWRLPSRPRKILSAALCDADISVEPEHAVELWAIAVSATAMLAAAVLPGLAIPAVLLGLFGAPIALRLARSRRERRFHAALPAALEQVAAELRGGGTVASAVERLADSDDVLAPDLRRVHVRTQLGVPLADALRSWPEDHDAPGVRASAGALAVATAMGGSSAEAIDGLASSLRHRLDAAAEAHALSAQARLSAVVVGVAPLAYLAFSGLVDRSAVTILVTTSVGRICLAAGLGLEAVAALWIRRIVASES